MKPRNRLSNSGKPVSIEQMKELLSSLGIGPEQLASHMVLIQSGGSVEVDGERFRLAKSGEQLPVSVCPVCGAKNDAATSLSDSERPSAGCISICAYCAHLSIFTDDMTLRSLTEDELNEIRGCDQSWQVIQRLQREIYMNGPVVGKKRKDGHA